MPFQNMNQNYNNGGQSRGNGKKTTLIKGLKTKDASIKIVVWRSEGTPAANGQSGFGPNTMLIVTPAKLIGKDPTTGKSTYQQVNIDGCMVFMTKEPIIEFITNAKLFKEEKVNPKFSVEGSSFKLDVTSDDKGIMLNFTRKLKDGREVKNDVTFEFNTIPDLSGRRVSYAWEMFLKALEIGLTKCIENGKFENPEDDDSSAASGDNSSTEPPF